MLNGKMERDTDTFDLLLNLGGVIVLNIIMANTLENLELKRFED